MLNLPLAVDKETAMHIEDKIVHNDIADAVSVATQKLKLAPSIVFQSKAVNLIEKIHSCKNVIPDCFCLLFYELVILKS